jgi:hypothetical protein
MRTIKSIRYKLDTTDEPKVVDDWQGRGRMLVPTPRLLDSLIREIEPGKLSTLRALRARLARDFNADLTCPLTTAIFMRIVAEVAEEEARAGRREVTPYWRVLRDNGHLHDTYPGAPLVQAERLRSEGHEILPDEGGRTPRVRDFERALQDL